MSCAATHFDGRSAAGRTVLVRVEDRSLVIVSREAIERVPLADVGVSEAFAHAPRMLRLPDGGTLEVHDAKREFAAALAGAGWRESWVVRLQRAWAAVAIGVFALVGAAGWLYVAGVPALARAVANAMPAGVERRLGDSVLAMLDERRFHASRLPRERQLAIETRFLAAAEIAAPGVDVRLLFRRGPVNAFALPGGTIVLFDGLVDLAQDDDQILGVLGHELGHVRARHSTRQLLQALGVGAVAGLLWGDFSTVAANVPIVLGVMRYGRAFEDEADAFALGFMRANGLPPQALVDFFRRVQLDERARGTDVPDFLRTHPDTQARIDRLQGEIDAPAK